MLGGKKMNTLTIQKAKADFDSIIDCCIDFDEEFVITTKSGNVVLLSEERYKKIVESLSLLNDIRETIDTPTKELKEAPWK